jgi:hypothetical protein
MPQSLQQITDAWGNWMNNQHSGGGVRFTASTNYGAHGELSNYHQYQVSTDVTGISYGTGSSPVPGQKDSASIQLSNGSNQPQTITFSQSMETTQEFNWAVSQEVSVGVSVSVTAGVPDVAQVGATVTASVSLTSAQGGSTSNTQTWSVDMPVNVPAESATTATLVVVTNQYDVPWTANCMLTGCVAIWFNNKIDLNGDGGEHWLYFVPIESVFNDCISNNITDTTGYQISGSGVIAIATGTFTGGQGISCNAQISATTPYSAGNTAAKTSSVGTPAAGLKEAASQKAYRIPLTPKGAPALVGVN